MIRSMTGYGSAKGKAAGLHLNIEIRSVNSDSFVCQHRYASAQERQNHQ